jgi:uncharacterized protein
VTEPATLALAGAGVLLIGLAKGAFGGGFAVIGIPLLALGMDPLQAGALLAPLFVVMDLVALRWYRPTTWSKPDLAVLAPGLALGIGLGAVLVGLVPARIVAGAVALVTLGFAAHFFLRGGRVAPRPRDRRLGFVAGTASGVTTMIAHAGGPPLAFYLLPLGLSKTLYAGTSSILFTFGNLLKLPPWLWAAPPEPATWWLMALCLPLCPLGVWAGVRLHARLDRERLMWWVHALLLVTAIKLGWDALAG